MKRKVLGLLPALILILSCLAGVMIVGATAEIHIKGSLTDGDVTEFLPTVNLFP